MKPRILALGLAAVLPAVVAIPAIDHALAAASPEMAASLHVQASSPAATPLGSLVVASAGDYRAVCGLANGSSCATAQPSVTSSARPANALFGAGGPVVVVQTN